MFTTVETKIDILRFYFYYCIFMKPSKKFTESTKSTPLKVKGTDSGSLTKLSKGDLVGRRVSKTELGPNKAQVRKSVVLVP